MGSADNPHLEHPHPRYDMGHVITPPNAKEMLGYRQMDLFVPILEKKPLT